MADTTTRRALLGSAASLSAAGAIIAAPALAGASQDDPALALCRLWQRLKATEDQLYYRSRVLRAEMVARYGGEEALKRSGWTLWEGDPDESLLGSLNDRVDQLGDERGDLADELRDIPATTLAGVVGKLRIALADYLPRPGGREYRDEIVHDYLTDAIRLLETARA